jgi:hypothetical protein
MSKKNLLNESQVRQFMKLASLEPLTPGFVEGLTGTTKHAEELEETHGRSATGDKDVGYGIDDTTPGRRVRAEGEEDELESELHATEDELGDEDRFADEEADELDALDAAPEEGGGDGRMVSVDDFLGALETALEGVLGDEVEIDSDEMEEPVEDEVEMDVELDAVDDVEDVEVEDEMLEETGAEDTGASEDDDSETHAGKDYEKNESKEATDELVEQITKRVAARILKSALAKKK